MEQQNRAYREEMQRKRDIHYLRDLLAGIKKYEGDLDIKKLQSSVKGMKNNVGKNIIINSDVEVYRTVSILLLGEYYNRRTEYYILNMCELLDKWFYAQGDKAEKKQKLKEVDILIIHLRKLQTAPQNMVCALSELLEIRRGKCRPTWIFMCNNVENEELQSLVEDYMGAIINLKT